MKEEGGLAARGPQDPDPDFAFLGQGVPDQGPPVPNHWLLPEPRPPPAGHCVSGRISKGNTKGAQPGAQTDFTSMLSVA